MGKKSLLEYRTLTPSEKLKRSVDSKKNNGFVALYFFIRKELKSEIVSIARQKGVTTESVLNDFLGEKVQEVKKNVQ